MPSDVSPNNPTYYNRKTIPQTGRIRKQKDSIIRIEDETDMRYRSKFELELANIVVRANVVPEDVNVPNPTSKSVLSVQT